MARLRGLRNFAIIALVALAIALAPGGGTGLAVVLWILTVAFFVAIALLGYRLYREHRFAIQSLSGLERGVAYASVALAFTAFTATNRLFGLGGGGILAWFALLGLASYGVFWVWRHATRYG